jgi:hypothetical protein
MKRCTVYTYFEVSQQWNTVNIKKCILSRHAGPNVGLVQIYFIFRRDNTAQC